MIAAPQAVATSTSSASRSSTSKSIGYDGWMTIEAFGGALPDLAAATRVWRDFFPSTEQVYTEGIALIKESLAS
jgi:hypothetical protein